MPINSKYLAPFVAGEFFHVYNRTNGSHKLFREADNYKYFIKEFEKYLSGVLDIYSYCLLPSHFHYMVKIKPLVEMQPFLNFIKCQLTDINKIVVKQFQAFFTSYTMAFNQFHDRQGSLFNHKFRRVAVDSIEAVKNCICYIHSNPVHHSLTKSFVEYTWNSYSLILSDEPSKIKKVEVLELFGGREEYIKFHQLHEPNTRRLR